MQPTFGYTSKILLLLLVTCGSLRMWAQTTQQAATDRRASGSSAKSKEPKPKEAKPVTGIRLYTDLLKLGTSLAQRNQTQTELGAELLIGNKHLVSLAGGTANVQRKSAQSTLVTKGSFVSVGIDHNFLSKLAGNHAVFIGLHAARAQLTQRLSASDSSYWGWQSVNFPTERATAFWLELRTGVKFMLTPHIGMGYTIRYATKPTVNKASFEPGDLPGYGLFKGGDKVLFSYNLYFLIPTRPKKKH